MRKGDENMEKKKEPSGIQKAWRQLSIQNQIFLSMFLITPFGCGRFDEYCIQNLY